MQSVKKIIAIAVCLFSAGAFAEPSTALPFPMATDVTKGTSSNKPTPDTSTNVAVGKAITETNTISEDNTVSDGRTSQEFLKEVVENDYDYQLKSRKLSQEVELEKMRSEIRKLRGEDKKTGACCEGRGRVSLTYRHVPSDDLLSELWEYHEFDGIGITASSDGEEYLLIHTLSVDKMFEHQLQIARLKSMHKRTIAGLAQVTEEEYYQVIEFISLKALNAAQGTIDITDTQKRLANILLRAVNMGASDLHITRNDVLALFEARVNGVLMPFMQIKSQQCDELVFVLYNVEATTRDTTWNRAIPQNANILYSLDGKPFRFRYAHFPIFGETPDCYHAVLRIIPSGLQKNNVGSIDKIGVSDAEITDLKKILSNPYGAYVIAGTTGSGKSTTLKSLMEWLQINRYDDRGCFLTVEDPVEYQIYGAKQSSVVSVDGGGFHAAIKSALRRDPDVLMVGEIRDSVSANALAGAVESGHYCFTTVHAGNIVSLLQRMSALGIGSDKLSTPGFIAGLQCQKLVPVLCESCKQVHEVKTISGREFTLYKAGENGCPNCKHSGIKGRQLAMEYFLPTYEELATISRQEWLNTYALWRKKRVAAVGLAEGFEIREKVMAHVLKGRIDAKWYAMEFGVVAQEDLEMIVGKIQ